MVCFLGVWSVIVAVVLYFCPSWIVSLSPLTKSEGGTPRFRFKFCVEPETSPQRATGLAERKKFLRPTIRLPFAVKFLESLEPSPKEGSKRGSGQSPEVFSPRYFCGVVPGSWEVSSARLAMTAALK